MRENKVVKRVACKIVGTTDTLIRLPLSVLFLSMSLILKTQEEKNILSLMSQSRLISNHIPEINV